MNKDAKKYSNIKLACSIFNGVVSFVLIFLFVYSGLSLILENYIAGIFSNSYVILVIYTAVIGTISSIIFFPINYYTEYHLEHKYNLSNQSLMKWLLENLKGAGIGSVIGFPLLLLFYFVLNQYGILWWFPFSILMFVVSVILSQIIPIFVLPLFYKISPIEDEDLKMRILNLSQKASLKISNILKFDMSKNTKKANAAFTGLGKTKRILLADTLLANYTNDEIETVIAHEMGHYKRKHIIKNLIGGTISSFLIFYLIAILHNSSLSYFGFTKITDIASLPIIVLLGSIIGLIQQPIMNYISRKYEYEADEFAVTSTDKSEAFISTLNKLTDQNLGDRNPHPLVEWFFYSHPTISRRIEAIKRFARYSQ